MQPRIAMWSSTYSHDRRKHRHKCRCCGKIINADEAVVMVKLSQRGSRSGVKTWALHEACAEKRHSETYTWREVFKVWAHQREMRLYGWGAQQAAKIEAHRIACGVPKY